MPKRCIAIAVLALAVLATGCESMGPKKPNAATAQWRAARAGVMAGLAREQFTNGNLEGAQKTAGEAIMLLPENTELRVLAARIAIEQGNLEKAEIELQQARTLNPKDASADYYYGVLMQRWQRMPRALEMYVAACEKNPKEVAYILAQAETLVAMDRENDALVLVQKSLTGFENSAELRSMQGQILVRQRKYEEAVEHLRQAVLLAPEESGLREQLARTLFLAKRPGDAAACLERLLNVPANAERADLHTLHGECLLALRKPIDAKAAFETASNLQPSNIQYTMNLAKVALEAGDLRRADIAAKRAIAQSPGDGQVNLLLGYVRFEQKKYPEALSAFQRAATADPKDGTALCMIGLVQEKLGDRQSAMEYYARAIAIHPGDELARERLGAMGAIANVSADDR